MVLLAACWLATLGNLPLWRALWQYEGGLHGDDLLFMLTAPLAVMAWTHLILLAIAWGRATPVVLATVLLASATVTYFEQTYGVLLDGSMVANLLQTHAAEAGDLLSAGLAGWLLVVGIFPAVAIVCTRASTVPLAREIGIRWLSPWVAVIPKWSEALKYVRKGESKRNQKADQLEQMQGLLRAVHLLELEFRF
jgi:lipid A ethanolaminephosphotransferase